MKAFILIDANDQYELPKAIIEDVNDVRTFFNVSKSHAYTILRSIKKRMTYQHYKAEILK